MSKILLVEDDRSLGQTIKTLLESKGLSVTVQENAESAYKDLREHNYDLVLSDFKLPGMSGLDLLKQVREIDARIPYLLMTAYGSIDVAVEALKVGANDFLSKPINPESLTNNILDVLKNRQITNREVQGSQKSKKNFLGTSPKIDQILHQAKKVARVDSSILILGESGTGKELLARYIHDQSPRFEKPFIAINCAALPADLLESELFGHEAGSFTGATQTRIGLFELASEGTIFLDEVGDMPAALQVKLLRALQEHEIKRVGGNKYIKINPRVICATNKDVEKLLETGEMREDFYFRIAVVTLEIPPLRERQQDIKILVDEFVTQACDKIGKVTLQIEEEANNILLQHMWPGNTRELENVIERAVVLADSSIKPEHLGIKLESGIGATGQHETLAEVSTLAAREAEIKLIENTLVNTNWNRSQAAKLLGVSYKTLLNKVKEYQLKEQK